MAKIIFISESKEVGLSDLSSEFPNLDTNPVRLGYLVKNNAVKGRKIKRTTLIDKSDFVAFEFLKSVGYENVIKLLPDDEKRKFENFKKFSKRKAA